MEISPCLGSLNREREYANKRSTERRQGFNGTKARDEGAGRAYVDGNTVLSVICCQNSNHGLVGIDFEV
jgi:hypothetical protein